VDLPPDAIKDAEGVGLFTQVFFVSDCQDGSVELGIAHPQLDEWEDSTAQRLLLKKGDSFYVPPGNIYRLENHSKVKSCFLFWTIIKPIDGVQEGNGSGDQNGSINNSVNNRSSVSPSSTHAVASYKREYAEQA
jgi:hypothetical protein